MDNSRCRWKARFFAWENVKEHPLESFVENIQILRVQGGFYKLVDSMLMDVCVTKLARFC